MNDSSLSGCEKTPAYGIGYFHNALSVALCGTFDLLRKHVQAFFAAEIGGNKAGRVFLIAEKVG